MVILRNVLLLFLAGYHKIVSPVMPRACRFYPSCSVYAFKSIQRHGILQGLSLSIRRLARCHPWNPGGYDPAK